MIHTVQYLTYQIGFCTHWFPRLTLRTSQLSCSSFSPLSLFPPYLHPSSNCISQRRRFQRTHRLWGPRWLKAPYFISHWNPFYCTNSPDAAVAQMIRLDCASQLEPHRCMYKEVVPGVWNHAVVNVVHVLCFFAGFGSFWCERKRGGHPPVTGSGETMAGAPPGE